tara:strand:+ start:389 stop:601 length:213 start_codon:yes stop_codon:yes gene_type:complete
MSYESQRQSANEAFDKVARAGLEDLAEWVAETLESETMISNVTLCIASSRIELTRNKGGELWHEIIRKTK